MKKEGEIPIEISARHVHLCKKDAEELFGKDFELKKEKDLFQPGEYATDKTVKLKGNSELALTARVIIPLREESQVEISKTDAIKLGVDAPIRDSGDLEETPGITLISTESQIDLDRGVINNWRHLHCNPEEAEMMNLENDSLISVFVGGVGSVTFHYVKVKVHENYKLCLHLDTDEGNAADIDKKGKGVIIKNPQKIK